MERQFKIKVGTLRRVSKDLEYYVKERKEQQDRIDRMRQEGADEYDIKKQEEVLAETDTMLPESQTRLHDTVRDVTAFLQDNNEEIQDEELKQQAQALVEAAQTLLK